MRSIRRICRKRRLRRDVASTFPWLRTATTGTEAISTKMSEPKTQQTKPRVKDCQGKAFFTWLMRLTRHVDSVEFLTGAEHKDADEMLLIRLMVLTHKEN